MPVIALLALAVLALTAGCGDDTLPRFARPPHTDAGAQDAGRDSGEQSLPDAGESPEDADAGPR